MTTHHCGTYSLDPYCRCYNQTGQHQYHYKQFNKTSQIYSCCDQITASLSQLTVIPDIPGGKITVGAKDFFDSLSSNKLTGCDFSTYFKHPVTKETDTVHFMNNYSLLYHNFLTVKELYNNFIAGTEYPTMDSNYVKCGGEDYYPYILSYRSPGQIYSNYSYICSKNTNNVFSSIEVGYGKIDFSITRFYDNATGQPCISKACQLVTRRPDLNNFGDVSNMGNSQPVYNNKQNEEKGGLIASSVLSLIFIFIGLYILWKLQQKIRKIESVPT